MSIVNPVAKPSSAIIVADIFAKNRSDVRRYYSHPRAGTLDANPAITYQRLLKNLWNNGDVNAPGETIDPGHR